MRALFLLKIEHGPAGPNRAHPSRVHLKFAMFRVLSTVERIEVDYKAIGRDERLGAVTGTVSYGTRVGCN